jgi:pSer/pThr/pTyr-binding forkhead associated (FHA) protein
VGRTATVYSDILDGGTGRLRCQLVAVDGPDRGRACLLGDREVTAGTAAGCDLVLSDDRVSARHVAVRAVESRFAVRDLASTNGTWIAEQRISEAPLSDGDEIRVGSTTLVFRAG